MKFQIEYTDGSRTGYRRRKLKFFYFSGIASSEAAALARFEKFRKKHPEVVPTGYCSYKWNLKDFPYGDSVKAR